MQQVKQSYKQKSADNIVWQFNELICEWLCTKDLATLTMQQHKKLSEGSVWASLQLLLKQEWQITTSELQQPV